MKTATIATALVLALIAPASAKPPPQEGWTLVDKGRERDYWIRNKDWMAGRPSDRNVLVWAWADHKISRTLSHEMMLVEIDCPSEGFRFVQTQQYSLRGDSTSLGATQWRHAPPESIVAEIVRLTCMEPSSETATSKERFW